MKRGNGQLESESGGHDLGSEIMTVREAADYLHCHYGTVGGLIRRGEIPAFRVGADNRRGALISRSGSHNSTCDPGKVCRPKGRGVGANPDDA